MTARVRGVAKLALGAVIVIVQLALIATGAVRSGDAGARVVAAGFVVGGGLVVTGAIEAIAGQPFRLVARDHKTLLQWLAFAALVLTAVGIVLATT